MSDRKGFDLGDYVEVKDRIRIFYELYGQGRLVTEDVTILTAPDDKQRVMVKALAYRTPDDPRPAVGYSWMELPGTTSYTRGSELENTETSAWGRAIAALGILVDKSIASAQEVQNKQDDAAPVETKSNGNGEVEELLGRIQKTGKVMKGGSQLYQGDWREEPEGHAMGFKLKLDGEDRDIPQVKVGWTIGETLWAARQELLGARVTVKGHLYNVKAPGRTAYYRLKVGERPEDFIETPDLRVPPLPDPEQAVVDANPTGVSPVLGQTGFDLVESARLDAEEAARTG